MHTAQIFWRQIGMTHARGSIKGISHDGSELQIEAASCQLYSSHSLSSNLLGHPLQITTCQQLHIRSTRSQSPCSDRCRGGFQASPDKNGCHTLLMLHAMNQSFKQYPQTIMTEDLGVSMTDSLPTRGLIGRIDSGTIATLKPVLV